MLGNRKLVLDRFSEVYDLLESWADEDFYDFGLHDIRPGAIYVIGRAQFNFNKQRIRELVESDTIKVVLCNPAEGSQTLASHCTTVHLCEDLVRQNKILLVGGGEMDSSWPYLLYDSFLPKILDYEENTQALSRSQEIYTKIDKPYRFLFLNGRTRTHRKYLMERFRLSGLLDQSLWSWLDLTVGYSKDIRLIHNGVDLIGQPHAVKLLPSHYEYETYKDKIQDFKSDKQFVKYDLFDNEWGEIYINSDAYIDTYFSVVTETVFDYPYSFRTEKIWKPVAMAHPWIAVANQGYYRDMHNLGFRSFGHLIDESFDQIENNQDRIDRIGQVVEDLCRQDLAQFLKECYTVCKYNQQHLAHMRARVRQEFPARFHKFIKEYHFDE
jgi:hypothetical protein